MPLDFGGAAQPVDQLRSRARRQAVHAQGGMAGIVEVVDHIERQAVAIGEPFDSRPAPCATASYDDARSASFFALRWMSAANSAGCRQCPCAR